MTVRLRFYVDVAGSRADALDQRDEIIDRLAALGIRVCVTEDGTDVYMAGEGVTSEAAP